MAILGSTIVTLSPWTLRNYIVTKSFIPLNALSGITLASTHNPVILKRINHGSYTEKWEASNWVFAEVSGLLTPAESIYVYENRFPLIGQNTKENERRLVELNEFLINKAMGYIKRYPGANIKISLHQIPILFHFYLPKSHPEKIRRLCLGFYFVVLILGAMGLIYSFNRRKELWIFYLLWVYGILIPLIFHARRRLRIPIELSILILSAVMIDKILYRLRRK